MPEKKVWFITGASRGLGVDIAKAALGAGHAVIATGRDAAKVAAVVGDHDNLLPIRLDVTLPQDAQEARAQWLAQNTLRRQDLYREFIEAAARCYVHALQHEEADIPGLVDLYAKIDRMRVLSSTSIIDIAERIALKIVETYSEPNRDFPELREMVKSRSVSLIREFSVACRTEFEAIRTW